MKRNRAILAVVLLLNLVLTTNTIGQSDLCASAPVLSVGSGCSATPYSLSGTWGAELPSPACGSNFRDGFFRFVATSTTTTIQITDNVGGPDPILAVYSSCGGAPIACSNNGNNADELVTITTTIGTTYYIAIMRSNNANNNPTTGTVCVYNGSVPLPNTDCVSGTQVCSTSSFSGNSNGFGVQELTGSNQGCLSGENQSSWYYFQATTSGTVAFTIVTNTTDYDFAVWNNGCGALGAPIRCSYAGTYSNTGLQDGLTQTSEGAGGDGFVDALDVVAGQTYILLVDNFSVDNTSFTLNWNFTNGATLNCTPIPLPVDFAYFKGERTTRMNLLSWITATELNNDYFILERSWDGVNWEKIAVMNGAGTSTTPVSYNFEDYDFELNRINYYRLTQVDNDGKHTVAPQIAAIDNHLNQKTIVKRYNLLGSEVNQSYKGVVIYLFEDGTTLKTLQ